MERHRFRREREGYTIKRFFFSFVLAMALLAPACAQSGVTSITVSASADGSSSVTWNFGGSYLAGQYASGDWWVVDPGTGIIITSAAVTAPAGAVSGMVSERNPVWGCQGIANVSGRRYDASRVLSLPNAEGSLAKGDSLVTVALTSASLEPTARTYAYACAVLTVVDEAQPADAFRPPYSRPNRAAASASDPLRFRLSQVPSARWALLPRKPRASVPELPPLAQTIAKTRGPWIDYLGGSEQGEIRPYAQSPTYGADVARLVSEAAGQLCLDYPDAGLRTLAANLIQNGIDTYGLLLEGAAWEGNGGHGHGRKFPFIFAAVMLDSPAMKSFALHPSANVWLFAEDTQTYYFDDPELPAYQGPPIEYWRYDAPGAGRVAVRGVRGWVDRLNGGPGDAALWRMYCQPDRCCSHEQLNIGQWRADYADLTQAKFEAYRVGVSSGTWVGMAAFMMLYANGTQGTRNEMVRAWNHDAFFDYLARWMSEPYAAAKDLYESRYSMAIGTQGASGARFIDYLWNAFSPGFPIPYRKAGGTTVPPLPPPSGLRIKL